MFPAPSWIPRTPEPYHEPLQSLAVLAGMLAVLHLLLWKRMNRANANYFRLIDYVWFLGAVSRPFWA